MRGREKWGEGNGNLPPDTLRCEQGCFVGFFVASIIGNSFGIHKEWD